MIERVGVVRFPGSNCDDDTMRFFQKYDFEPEYIWYRQKRLGKRYDLLVLPGGFAFGDRVYEKATGLYTMDPGKQALETPVMGAVYRAAKDGMPILGICNGFQILVHAGLLPGSQEAHLEQNETGKFYCDYVDCKIEGKSFFGDASMLGRSFRIGVAHGFGKYTDEDFNTLETNGQVFLRYVDFNPNGSVQNIAGVCNPEGTIYGMMPHPERSPDQQYFVDAIRKYVGN